MDSDMSFIKGRRVDIDYLRVISILAVFVFHGARAFDTEGWHVKNPVTGMPFDAIVFILHKWIMPIFFVMAGTGAWYSLQSRSPGLYLKERVYRLLVPLVFGIFTIIPHQVYIERITNGEYRGLSLIGFYPRYFDGFYAFGGNFAWMGLHLWFLLVLFLFSIVTLPIFLAFRKTRILNGIKISKPLGLALIYLLLILIFLSEILLSSTNGFGEGRSFGGWFLMDYLLFFIFGYVLIPRKTVMAILEEFRWVSLIISLSTLMMLIYMRFRPLPVDPDMLRGVNQLLTAATTWIGLSAFFGIAARNATRSDRFLEYASPAVMPFYVFHQSVIVAVAYFMLPILNHLLVLKYFLLLAVSFIFTLLSYEFVRRVPGLAFLYGIKEKPRH